jgi:hypothetical protein
MDSERPPKRKRIAGKLAQPIDATFVAYPNPFASDKEERKLKVSPDELPRVVDALKTNAQEWQRCEMEVLERLELLFHYYGINRTGNDGLDFKLLACRMAEDKFPGFHINGFGINQPEPYEHKRNNPLTLILLLADIEMIRRERAPEECLDKQAIGELLKRKEWEDQDEKTLSNWLGEARDPEKNRFLPYWQDCEARGDLGWLIENINRFARGEPHPEN